VPMIDRLEAQGKVMAGDHVIKARPQPRLFHASRYANGGRHC
jgi:hypothetical protein